MNKIKNYNPEKKIEFKYIIFDNDDSLEQRTYYSYYYPVIIPHGTYEIEENAFRFFGNNISKLVIPETVKIIPEKFLRDCSNLIEITIPLKHTQIIIGNKICINNSQHLKKSLELSTSISKINGMEVENTAFTIPSYITSIDNTFFNKWKIQSLSFESPFRENFDYSFVKEFRDLNQISIPFNETLVVFGNKIFKNQSHFDQLFLLPSSIQKINGNDVDRLTLGTLSYNIF